ncbi:MAG: protein kinase domain-containing protein [Parachlamydiaceae bacterium]
MTICNSSSIQNLKQYWPLEVSQSLKGPPPFFPMGSDNFARYTKILSDLELFFNLKMPPKIEEKKLKRIVFLHSHLEKSHPPIAYPTNTHFKKDQQDEITFLSSTTGNLFALCKIYLSIHEEQGTAHKKMRLAIKIDDLAFFIFFSLSKNASAKARKFLENEINILTRLNPSKFILPIEFQANSYPHLHYLCPFTRLGDFTYLIQRFLRSDNEEIHQEDCIPFLHEILLGIKEIHRAGLVHRDIKPENILLFEDSAKLADFEYAISHEEYRRRIEEDYLAGSDVSLSGTLEYLAPEALLAYAYLHGEDLYRGEANSPLLDQLESKAFDYLSDFSLDVWSLGVIFYEILNKEFFIDNAFKKVLPMIRWYCSLDQESFESCIWTKTYEDPFLRKLELLARFTLKVDPVERPTIEKVLQKFEELTSRHAE